MRKPTKSLTEVRNPEYPRLEEDALHRSIRERSQQEPPKLTTLSARYRVESTSLYTVGLGTVQQDLFYQLEAHARAEGLELASAPQMREWADHATDCYVYEMTVHVRPREPLASSSDVSTLKTPWR